MHLPLLVLVHLPSLHVLLIQAQDNQCANLTYLVVGMLALHVAGSVTNTEWVHVLELADATQILRHVPEHQTKPLVNLKMILMVVHVRGMLVQILVLVLAIIPLVMPTHLVIRITQAIVIL